MDRGLEKNLVQGCTDIQQVKTLFGFSDKETEMLKKIQEMYPMFVNPYYFSLIDIDDEADPIRKLCIPSVEELDTVGSFDTSGEKDNTVLPGLQHKYKATALILSNNRCAMYCRHCFRRRMVGISEKETSRELKAIVDYLNEHTEISNVLISGGDAFMNSNELIEEYLKELSAIPHLDLIRFGTRIPVVFPQRITADLELRDILCKYNKKKIINIVTQFNHPREITQQSAEAVEQLLDINILVKNQTVLLKGINDDSYILGDLIKKLTAIGVIPYYVFQCRPVTGVMNHFQIPLRKGYEITEAAKNMQSGMGKCFRFVMSHITGKIEILGALNENNMIFKYHQTKDEENRGRIFVQQINENQCWL